MVRTNYTNFSALRSGEQVCQGGTSKTGPLWCTVGDLVPATNVSFSTQRYQSTPSIRSHHRLPSCPGCGCLVRAAGTKLSGRHHPNGGRNTVPMYPEYSCHLRETSETDFLTLSHTRTFIFTLLTVQYVLFWSIQ